MKRFYDRHDPMTALYRHRDAILDMIADHRNCTYFPTITVVPGEDLPRYDPEYVVPENMREALQMANEDIAKATAKFMAHPAQSRSADPIR